MSHPEQMGFVETVVRANEALVAGARILEIGSYDVNGSMRQLFKDAKTYVGVDLAQGPGVDVVEYGHRISASDASFDLTVSGECFEHDEHWQETLANMCRLTRPGGLVIVTCASTGRPEHGTRRTNVHESPGTQSRGLDYYRNLTERDFRALPGLELWFDHCLFSYNPTSFDLYFVGLRRGTAPPHALLGALPEPSTVDSLRHMMPWPHRLARTPLRLLLRVLPSGLYQEFAFRYWRLLLVLARRVGRVSAS